MKRTIIISLILMLNYSCKKEDYCSKAFDRLTSLTFKGQIFLCNAQPPEMDFLDATATVSTINTNEISVHLISDTSFIDTVLFYKTTCNVVERTIPNTSLTSMDGNHGGYYNYTVDAFACGFAYKGCFYNTHFEGFPQ